MKGWFNIIATIVTVLVITMVGFIIFFATKGSIRKEYTIGVVLCGDGDWQNKFLAEVEQSTYINADVSVITAMAHNSIERQQVLIDSLINEEVDILVVEPSNVDSLHEDMVRAKELNIPVIVLDKNYNQEEFTAFIGSDNYAIGEMLADYAAQQMGGRGNIVEIMGQKDTPPAIERHKGFTEGLKRYPDMRIVATMAGDWTEASGEKAMNTVLKTLQLPQGEIINCIFAANDLMAGGAYKALDRHKKTAGASEAVPAVNPIFLGVDALPQEGKGLEMVRNGILTASAINPTHGNEVVSLALRILKGEPYEKENYLQSSLVTQYNANVLLLQYREIMRQHHDIKKMNERMTRMYAVQNTERIVFCILMILSAVICMLMLHVIRYHKMKQRLYEELERKNEELNLEKEKVEEQRDELEEQHDQLLDALTEREKEAEAENEFMKRFLEFLDHRIADPNLSVEDLGEDLCLSRVQLYRKVKASTGRTPVEIIREERLKRARILIANGNMSISEVAYRVGFSAPSYFTKCYKKYYGNSPSEE